MPALFDHLTAILVGATLLVALLFVQTRQRQGAVQATVRHAAEAQAASAFSVLQRDAENLRTEAQTRAAFGAHRLSLRRATGPDGQSYTSQFAFATLAEPARGVASPLAIVVYVAEPTGGTVRVGTGTRPTLRVTRYAYRRGGAVVATGGAENVVDFHVSLVRADGTLMPNGGPTLAGTPAQVRLAMSLALPGVARRAADQAETRAAPLVRHTETVRVAAAGSRGGLSVPEAGAGGIPQLVGDPPPPPSSGGSSGPSQPSSPPPTSSPSPPPPSAPPPPPPAPPPGRSI